MNWDIFVEVLNMVTTYTGASVSMHGYFNEMIFLIAVYWFHIYEAELAACTEAFTLTYKQVLPMFVCNDDAVSFKKRNSTSL